MKKPTAHILRLLLALLVAVISGQAPLAAAKKPFVVVIDAGHGGHDPGAIGRKGKEKTINLSVALKLGRLIQANCADTRVVYTRSKDVFVPLHRRAEIANGQKADLFISIHTNSLASRKAQINGAETYTLGLHRTQDNLEVAKKENSVILIEDDYKQQYSGFNPNSSESYIIFEFMQDKNMAQSVNLAKLIQQQFRTHANRVDKGMHQAGFLVLRETSMPSVLVELGYITNPREEAFLLSEQGSATMAKSIYQAFLKYRQRRPSAAETEGEPAPPVVAVSEPAPEPPAAPSAGEEEDRRPDTIGAAAPPGTGGKPVFMIQILTADRKLPKQSRRFKGLAPVDYYQENGIYKYVFGEDTDYNKVLRLKRTKVDAKFKDAFIIAFKNGEKMNINQAIREFKRNKK